MMSGYMRGDSSSSSAEEKKKMDLFAELEHAEFKEAFDEFDKVRNSNSSRRTG